MWKIINLIMIRRWMMIIFMIILFVMDRLLKTQESAPELQGWRSLRKFFIQNNPHTYPWRIRFLYFGYLVTFNILKKPSSALQRKDLWRRDGYEILTKTEMWHMFKSKLWNIWCNATIKVRYKEKSSINLLISLRET